MTRRAAFRMSIACTTARAIGRSATRRVTDTRAGTRAATDTATAASRIDGRFSRSLGTAPTRCL